MYVCSAAIQTSKEEWRSENNNGGKKKQCRAFLLADGLKLLLRSGETGDLTVT
jgi:hypothetical protein